MEGDVLINALLHFVRVQYDYDGKYLSGVLRRDGSTHFGPDRFGFSNSQV
jgi:hypothetical protein